MKRRNKMTSEMIIGAAIKAGIKTGEKALRDIEKDIENGAGGGNASDDAAKASEKVINDTVKTGADIAKSAVSAAWGKSQQNLDHDEEEDVIV